MILISASVIMLTNSMEVKQKLESGMIFSVSWFSENGFQLNAEKCKLSVFRKPKDSDLVIQINGNPLNESSVVELLGITIDNQLTYKHHVEKLCKKASAKIVTLRRISLYMPQVKRKLIANDSIGN